MIQDSLWKLLGILICIVMLFIVPTMLSYQRQDAIAYNLVLNEVNSFSEQIREVGYIDHAMLNQFYSTIQATGNNYSVEFEHLAKTFSSDGIEIKVYYEGTYTDDIIDMINSNNRYTMKIGDFFFIHIHNTSLTKSQSFNQLVGLSSKGASIQAVSGGVIRYGDT
jgi:hypothetical protein